MFRVRDDTQAKANGRADPLDGEDPICGRPPEQSASGDRADKRAPRNDAQASDHGT